MTTIKFTKQTNREFRTTKDGFVRTNRTTDALQPLVDAMRQLELSTDRYLARVEEQRAARRDARLGPLRAYLSRPVQAYELDETASLLRRYPIFGDRP